jgi:hypothetical protein
MGIGSLFHAIEVKLHLVPSAASKKPAAAAPEPARRGVDTRDRFVASQSAKDALARRVPGPRAAAAPGGSVPSFGDGDAVAYKDFSIKTVSYTILDKMNLESAQKAKDKQAIAREQQALDADYAMLDQLRAQGAMHARAWGQHGFDPDAFWAQQEAVIPARETKPAPTKPSTPTSPSPAGASTPLQIQARYDGLKAQLDHIYKNSNMDESEYDKRITSYVQPAVQDLLANTQHFTFDERKQVLMHLYNASDMAEHEKDAALGQLVSQCIQPLMANRDVSFDARKAVLMHLYNGSNMGEHEKDGYLDQITADAVTQLMADRSGSFDDRKKVLFHLYKNSNMGEAEYDRYQDELTKQALPPL